MRARARVNGLPPALTATASDVALFLGLFDKSFAQTVAQSLLADVRKEVGAGRGMQRRLLSLLVQFSQLYDARRVAAGSSAYFLMEFESFLEKSKKAYSQSASARALDKINGNLSEIQRVMSKSLNEVVSRGDDLDQLSSKSDTVLMESEQYRKASVDLNRAKWLQKYGVLLLIVVVIGGLLWVRVSYFSA